MEKDVPFFKTLRAIFYFEFSKQGNMLFGSNEV
jgi:hypothetical protein